MTFVISVVLPALGVPVIRIMCFVLCINDYMRRVVLTSFVVCGARIRISNRASAGRKSQALDPQTWRRFAFEATCFLQPCHGVEPRRGGFGFADVSGNE